MPIFAAKKQKTQKKTFKNQTNSYAKKTTIHGHAAHSNQYGRTDRTV